MIYTLGHRENYLKAIAESDEGYIEKLGRTENYQGGCTFRTFEDALRIKKVLGHGAWGVFGLEADWERDTESNPDYEWHDLLHDSKIIVLEEGK